MDDKKTKAQIRWMIRRDLPTVLEIEQTSFPKPWTEDCFIQALRQRNCIGMVAEVNEEVVGFIIYELNKKRINVINMAVSPDWRNKGIATDMLNKLKAKLSVNRRDRIEANVAESNLDAQIFFKMQSFLCIKINKNFYVEDKEDAYLFEYICLADAVAEDGLENGRMCG